MTVSQAVQSSYMAPNVFKDMNNAGLKVLSNKIKQTLDQLLQRCPQSPEKDCTVYQYKHVLNVINKVMN